jgi:membrane-associated protein
MTAVTSLLLALPASVILLVAFLLPAAEASTFLGIVVPGETAVLVAGVLAHSGRLPLWAVILAATLGAVLGDQVGFFLGRRHGQPLLDRLPRWIVGMPGRSTSLTSSVVAAPSRSSSVDGPRPCEH